MQKKKTIEAKTFTCQYSEKEDRILLSINYKDIQNRVDFWITRSFLLKLLPHFFDLTTELKVQKMQNALPNTSPTDTSTFALTKKSPVLLESIDISSKDKNMIQIIFKNLEHNIYCIANFDMQSFNTFVKLIISTSPKIHWGIYDIN